MKKASLFKLQTYSLLLRIIIRMFVRQSSKGKALYFFSALLQSTLVGLLIQLAFSSFVYANTPKVQFEIVPATVKVSPDKQTQVLVVMRNPTTATLGQLKLSWFTDAVLNIKGNDLTLDTLSPQSEHAWEIQLSAHPDQEFVPGIIYFRLDYSVQGGDTTGASQRIALGSLDAQSGALEDADKIADVKIETTLAALNEQNPGKVYLVITNKTVKTINATVTPNWPYGIKADEEDKRNYSVTLSPRQTNSIEIGVKAKERVRPGKYLMVFDVGLEWKEPGHQETRRKIVTQPVEIGVLGESQILTLLGVPSFLLLPGFLVLATIKAVWSWGLFKVKGQPASFPWEIKSAEFIVSAVTLSLFITGGYSLLWHNLLDGYGLRDIIAVWVISVFAIGLLGYALVTGVYERLRRRTTPSGDDDVITTLKKLKRRDLGIYLERAAFKIKENDKEAIQHAFLLESLEEEGETIWVAPRIGFTWGDNMDDEFFEEFKTSVEAQLKPGGENDPGRLAELLEKGMETNNGQRAMLAELKWQAIGKLIKPVEMKKSDMLRSLGGDAIVQEI